VKSLQRASKPGAFHHLSAIFSPESVANRHFTPSTAKKFRRSASDHLKTAKTSKKDPKHRQNSATSGFWPHTRNIAEMRKNFYHPQPHPLLHAIDENPLPAKSLQAIFSVKCRDESWRINLPFLFFFPV
jgi:hypothetical protein